MGYIEKNMDYLRQFRSALSKKIERIIEKHDYEFDSFNMIETKDKNQTIEVEKEGKKIRLNSLYSPVREAEQWSKQYDFNKISVSVIMFGIANGVYAKVILEKLKKDAVFFLIEPDINLFMYSLYNFDLTDIISDSRIAFIIDTINYNDLHLLFMENISDIMLPNQIICYYPNFEKIYQKKLNEFIIQIQRSYSCLLSMALESKEIIKNALANNLRNLHFIKESNYISEFIGKIPKDVPVIIVAAGPSLDKNIEDLKKAEKKAFIIAVDTAVKFLIAHSVHFDVIITKDVKKSDAHLSDERCFEYPIIADIRSKNSILEMNQGRKIWNNTSDFMRILYGKHGLYYSTGMQGLSVATDAFVAAELIGVKRIILVGQDLAYSDKYTHAGGVANHIYDEQNGIIEVEDIHGGMIKSRGDWVEVIDWFNAEIERNIEKIEVIDATEGGAKIKNTKIMKLSDAINKFCIQDYDFSDTIKDMPPTFSNKKYIEVKKDLINLKEEMQQIRDKSKDGAKLADKMICALEKNELKNEEEYENIKKIKEINLFIETQLVYAIIYDYIETNMENLLKINVFEKDRKKDSIMSYKLSKEAFDAVVETVDYALPILECVLPSL